MNESYIKGIYDYHQTQRKGKITLLVGDALRVLRHNRPYRTLANFEVTIPGVEVMNSERLIEEMLNIKREKLSNILILFDELSQVLTGRGYSGKKQTEVSTFLWQMPKRKIVLLLTSNPGKSIDLIIRNATWDVCIPDFQEGYSREENDLAYTVIDGRSMIKSGINAYHLRGVKFVQSLFDTDAPID